MKIINIEGAHTHCDNVIYKSDDDGWSEAWHLIESALENFGDDVGDTITIKVTIQEISEDEYKELIPANEF